MLLQTLTKIALPTDEPECLREDCVMILQRMASQGYLGQRHLLNCESRSGDIVLGGLLSAPDAWELALAAIGARPNWQPVCSLLSTPISHEILEVAWSSDDHYCEHDPCPSLRIVIDESYELSPLRCEVCNGLVGRHRLILPASIADDLWNWSLVSARVEQCRILSGLYETWAENELANSESPLNKKGRKLAAMIAHEVGIKVRYAKPALNIQ